MLLFRALNCDNAPMSLNPAMNRVVRTIVTGSPGIGACVVRLNWFAMKVLNEAAIVPGFGGDP